jgi:hypothetical protein
LAALVAKNHRRLVATTSPENHREHRTVQLARRQDTDPDETEMTPEEVQREEDLRDEYAPRPLHRPEYYRRAHRSDEYNDYESRRDDQRDERWHPRHYRVDEGDRWRDRY